MQLSQTQLSKLIHSSGGSSQSESESKPPMRILLSGKTATGKTESLKTLLGFGKILVLDYDQNCTQFHGVSDVEVVRFGGVAGGDGVAYWAAEYYITKVLKEKVLDEKIAIVVQDSLSSLSMMALAAVAEDNHRLGKPPQLQDWNQEMHAVMWACMSTCSAPISHANISICHTESAKDEFTGRLETALVLTGKMGSKLPRLFPEIYHACVIGSGDKRRFVWKVMPEEGTIARTSVAEMQKAGVVEQDFRPVLETYFKEG